MVSLLAFETPFNVYPCPDSSGIIMSDCDLGEDFLSTLLKRCMKSEKYKD